MDTKKAVEGRAKCGAVAVERYLVEARDQQSSRKVYVYDEFLVAFIFVPSRLVSEAMALVREPRKYLDRKRYVSDTCSGLNHSMDRNALRQQKVQCSVVVENGAALTPTRKMTTKVIPVMI